MNNLFIFYIFLAAILVGPLTYVLSMTHVAYKRIKIKYDHDCLILTVCSISLIIMIGLLVMFAFNSLG